MENELKNVIPQKNLENDMPQSIPEEVAPKEKALKKEDSSEVNTENQLKELLGYEEGDLYGKAVSHINSLNSYKEQNESLNEKLLDVFKTNDDVSDFMRDMLNGAEVNVAIARNFDMSNMQPQEGDPDYKEWNKALEDRKKKVADKSAYLKEVDDNIQLSAKELDAFAKANNLSKEDAGAFLNEIDELMASIMKGKVSKAVLTRFYKGINYDNDLENNAKTAEVKGRNAKIEDLKIKDNKNKGDGIPKLTAQNKIKQPEPKVKKDVWSQAVESQLRKNKY